MKICILDGGSTNPGDISWAPIEKYGETTVYYNTPSELVIERAKDADVIVMNRINLSREVVNSLPNLKLVAALATGYNSIDLEVTKERNIPVCNVPVYCIETVAQHAFALLLALCNHVEHHSEMIKNGKWDESITHSSTVVPFFELYGKTLGIVGYGNIGKTVANMAKALGMKIIVYTRTKRENEDGIEFVSLNELMERSDVISLHCALSDATRGLISREKIAMMKNTALIINTARGAVVDEEALAEALNENKVAGYATDVMTHEPPLESDSLLKAKNTVFTSHIAWASRDARMRLVEVVAGNIGAFIEGKPRNVVNGL